MKKIAKILSLTVAVLFGLLYVSDYNYLLTAVSTIYMKGHITAYLSDYENFDNRILAVSENPQPWPLHSKFNSVRLTEAQEQIHFDNGTVAFLLFKNDSLFFEKYYDGYGVDSKSNSFSMAKSYVAALLGKAIMEGYIESLTQPVKDFFPELKGGELLFPNLCDYCCVFCDGFGSIDFSPTDR
jgi:hypothetical protein